MFLICVFLTDFFDPRLKTLQLAQNPLRWREAVVLHY